MAEKKPLRRDIVAKAKSDLPDVFDGLPLVESEEFSEEDDMMLRACRDERSFRSSLKETPFLDRLVDSRIDFVRGDWDELNTSSSFRFDVGNGFVLDYSSMGQPSSEIAVSILETVLPLVPLMKDGVEIEVDNYDPGILTITCDGFKTRPPGNTYTGSGVFLYESSRDEVDKFEGMPVNRICYCYGDKDVYEDTDVFDNTVELTHHVFYAVKHGDIHVLFPSRPTRADLEWVSGIRPFLESLTKARSTEGRYTSTHFVLWRDGSGAPSDKKA